VGYVGGAGGGSPLVRALEDNGPMVRYSAAYARAKIGPEAAPAFSALRRMTSDEDWWVRRGAATAIERITRPAPGARR